MKLQDVKNICQKCKGTCCKLGGAEFTLKEMQRVLKAGYPNKFRKINANHYETITKNGVCSYLKKDYSCLIQNLKPRMCWAWPVHLDYIKNKKRYYLMKCPLTPYLSEKDIKLMKKQISGYSKEMIFCDDTKMSDAEVKKVMSKYYKFRKKTLI